MVLSDICAAGSVKICLTGRVVANLPSYGESFENAAYLAKSESRLKNSVLISSYFYNNKPLEPLRVYNKMTQDGCSAIVGFEYLSDLLLVIGAQRSAKLPIFTSYASTADSDQIPKNIFMFMPAYDFLAHKMLLFLTKKFGTLSDVLLITEVGREEMRKYKEVYSRLLNEQGVAFDTLDFIEVSSKLEETLRTNKKNYKFIFLLSSAIESSKIADLMNEHKEIFIGTENFGSSANQTFYMLLKDKKINSYFIRNIDFLKSNKALHEFEYKYKKNYRKQPTMLSVYTYDAVKIILNAFEKYHYVTVSNIHDTNFNALSSANIKNKRFIRSNEYAILSVTMSGYQYEE